MLTLLVESKEVKYEVGIFTGKRLPVPSYAIHLFPLPVRMAALLAAPVAVHDGGNVGGERDALGRPTDGGRTSCSGFSYGFSISFVLRG